MIVGGLVGGEDYVIQVSATTGAGGGPNSSQVTLFSPYSGTEMDALLINGCNFECIFACKTVCIICCVSAGSSSSSVAGPAVAGVIVATVAVAIPVVLIIVFIR